ncbi:MAG: asparagine--tRNA ligase [Desulfobacterales bacterium]
MKRIKINRLLGFERPAGGVTVKGWVRTRRDAKDFSFLEVNDGSCLKNLQVIADRHLSNYSDLKKLTTGSAVSVTGDLISSKGAGQKWELAAKTVEIISIAPEDYPLQKKRHSDEYLRTIAHLRARTNKYGAAFRIRSGLSDAVHSFFKKRGFVYIHTPIITGSDCEGAGELFRVSTLDFLSMPITNGDIDFSQDFFGKEAGLTVSGQLSAEMLALALGDVYTFGPTFRAEHSHTSRHMAEFWMVEPEMAFCDLYESMDLGENLIKYLTHSILQSHPDDIELFAKFVDKGLRSTLDNLVNSNFVRLTYSESIDILNSAKRAFDFEPVFGRDLQSEHERYLTEIHFKKPVIVYNFPKSIKPFYMRVNDDQNTVAAMDILVPKIGEIIGGSQREERLGVLELRMMEMNLDKEVYWWYLDSRRYGSVPHSGFGLGFERMMMLVTGIKNIRDVIPFPRTPKSIEF